MGLRSRVRDALAAADWIYVFVGRLDLPTDGKKLVLHAPGTLVYVLLAVWTVGAAGVMVWKIGSHLAFRRRILKNAVPVTDRQTLHVWEIELERAWHPEMQVEARALRRGHDAAVYRSV